MHIRDLMISIENEKAIVETWESLDIGAKEILFHKILGDRIQKSKTPHSKHPHLSIENLTKDKNGKLSVEYITHFTEGVLGQPI